MIYVKCSIAIALIAICAAFGTMYWHKFYDGDVQDQRHLSIRTSESASREIAVRKADIAIRSDDVGVAEEIEVASSLKKLSEAKEKRAAEDKLLFCKNKAISLSKTFKAPTAIDSASTLDPAVQELVALLLFVDPVKKFQAPEYRDTGLEHWKVSKRHVTAAVNLLKTKKDLKALNKELGAITENSLWDTDRLSQVALAMDLLLLSKNRLSPLDAYLERINANITILEKRSKEYAQIRKYVENHEGYFLLTVEEVFKFDSLVGPTKFDSLSNHRLLWHGTELENIPSILAQGLMIHPPISRPTQGAIYFADRVEESLRYCSSTVLRDFQLLLLCDVALGNIEENNGWINSFDKLPAGKYSVKLNGVINPDMTDVGHTEDGVLIPFGKNIEAIKPKFPRYSEYKIFQNSQVQIKYLVKMKKSGRDKYEC